MISWIAENSASMVLLLVVAAIVFFLLRSRIREHKQGSCGCGCSGCTKECPVRQEEKTKTNR